MWKFCFFCIHYRAFINTFLTVNAFAFINFRIRKSRNRYLFNCINWADFCAQHTPATVLLLYIAINHYFLLPIYSANHFLTNCFITLITYFLFVTKYRQQIKPSTIYRKTFNVYIFVKRVHTIPTKIRQPNTKRSSYK